MLSIPGRAARLCDGPSRREMLRIGGAGLLGLGAGSGGSRLLAQLAGTLAGQLLLATVARGEQQPDEQQQRDHDDRDDDVLHVCLLLIPPEAACTPVTPPLTGGGAERGRRGQA